MELLEDEADGLAPQPGPFGITQACDVVPSDGNYTRGGKVKETEQAQQGGLARTGGSDDRQEVAGSDVDGHVPEGVYLHAGPVDPGNATQGKEALSHRRGS